METVGAPVPPSVVLEVPSTKGAIPHPETMGWSDLGGQGKLSSCPFRGQRGWVLLAGPVGNSDTRHLSLPYILAGAAAKCSRFSWSPEGQNIIPQIFRIQTKIGRHTRTRTITTRLRKESADTNAGINHRLTLGQRYLAWESNFKAAINECLKTESQFFWIKIKSDNLSKEVVVITEYHMER